MKSTETLKRAVVSLGVHIKLYAMLLRVSQVSVEKRRVSKMVDEQSPCKMFPFTPSIE